MKNKIISILSQTTGMFLSILSFNAQSTVLDGFELSAALGGSWYHADNTTMQITVDERDANKVSSSTSNLLYSAGIGRHVFNDALKARNTLTGLLIQANYYYGVTTVKGNVWGYESPNVNNYTFRAPMSSSRLMLDFKPELFVYRGFTPYAIIGAGASWNKMSYSENANSDVDPASAVTLQDHSSVTVAYDLGAGISTNILDNASIALEYMYTALGDISPSINSRTQQPIVGAPSFSIAGQSVMLRLNWKMDGISNMK